MELESAYGAAVGSMQHRLQQLVSYGLQANAVKSFGSAPLSSGPVRLVGLVQSGPRSAGSTGAEIIASGPALCSPLNGVGLLASNPQAVASFGLLNQNPDGTCWSVSGRSSAAWWVSVSARHRRQNQKSDRAGSS